MAEGEMLEIPKPQLFGLSLASTLSETPVQPQSTTNKRPRAWHRLVGVCLYLAGILAGFTTSTPALGGALADPRGFLSQLYAHYPVAEKHRAFDPLGVHAPKVFDAALTALIQRDQRNAHGEVGALDGDPLCDCQDDYGMTWRIMRVDVQGADRAVADVRLTFPQTPHPLIDNLVVTLVMTPDGWRIHDIASPNTPSLRGLLNPRSRKSGYH